MDQTIPKDSFAARRIRMQVLAKVDSEDLELPLLPDSAAQVLAACNSEDCDARGLADLITRDPALASHVLRVANSVAYAPEEPIVSLQQAVHRLGTGTLCGIAVSVVAQTEVFDLPGHEQRLAALWRHSAATAAWAKEVARHRRRNVEAAFLAGLLHDIGQPIVLQAISGIQELSGLIFEPELVETWLEEFHSPVGARLLATWGLPPWVSVVVAHHLDPSAATEYQDEARTVCLANLLAHATDGPQGEDPALLDEVRRNGVLEGLGLYVDELDELLERTQSVLDFARVFL